MNPLVFDELAEIIRCAQFLKLNLMQAYRNSSPFQPAGVPVLLQVSYTFLSWALPGKLLCFARLR